MTSGAEDATPLPERRGPTPAQARWIVGAVALCAVVALFLPRGDKTFEAPGGFPLDAGGRPVPLGTRMAPVTLVHFWSTWCPPCLTEIPAIQRLGEELHGEPSFRLLLVAVDDEVAKVETFLGDRAGGVLYDPAWEIAHRYGTRKLPETYLVVGGEVVEKWVGATDWDAVPERAKVLAALARRDA